MAAMEGLSFPVKYKKSNHGLDTARLPDGRFFRAERAGVPTSSLTQETPPPAPTQA